MIAGEVRRLFFEALEIEAAERPAYLERCGAAPDVRDAVLTLLRHDAGSETFMEEAVSRELPRTPGEGERFGPYQLRRLLGRGGMGAVFLAERVDGELRQVVAIKIVERGWLDPQALERFRQERQILAGLVHPNIAQLLDGGTREDGVPYLVMEYVEGPRLDEYCEQQRLDIPARLRVFLPLCDAVDYAHRKLVVHRDLKPSNALVTADGAPKLLDFGVAKALDAHSGGRTQTLVLTPDFASPEQVRGEEVTTATDVYGLGAVLYHMLTGRPPHAAGGLSPRDLERAVCEVGPPRPASLRPELRGDLENILLKALHPQPSGRYRSAQELAEDIQRYLGRLPVRATPYRLRYRARRFVERHAIATTAAVIGALAIAAGTGAAVYQQRRAVQRFNQVRELANRFIFDFERSIRDVPGTLAARRMVSATARQYLASLSADSGGDAGLTRELAESHYRLARVETNSGETQAARQDNEQAVALLRGIRADCCRSAADRLLFVQALSDLGRGHFSHDAQSAVKLSFEAVGNARAWIAAAPSLPEAQQALTAALSTHGVNLQAAGRLTEARQTLQEAVEWGARVVRQHPEDDDRSYDLARVSQFLSGMCLTLHDGACARAYGGQAAESLRVLTERHPDNARWRDVHAMAVSADANGISLLAERDVSLRGAAVDAARHAYKLAQANAQANPGKRDEADTASVLASRLAAALQQAGRRTEALAQLREARDIAEGMTRRDPGDQRAHRLRLNYGAQLGEMLMEDAQWEESARVLAAVDSQIEEFLRADPADMIVLDLQVSVLTDQAIVRRRQGRADEARALCRSALSVAAGLIRRDAAMEASLGDLAKLRQQARALGVPDPTGASRDGAK